VLPDVSRRTLTQREERIHTMQDVVMREESLARIWRELIPETPTGGGGQGSPAVPESERTLK
jgi:hypothetical protein